MNKCKKSLGKCVICGYVRHDHLDSDCSLEIYDEMAPALCRPIVFILLVVVNLLGWCLLIGAFKCFTSML